MANVVEKFGLRPVQKTRWYTFSWSSKQIHESLTALCSTAIYQGDLVIPLGTGNTQLSMYARILSDAVIGVFNGCFYTDPTTQKPTYSNYYPGGIAASDITAFVVDDPDAVFLMDADATFTRADLYKNYSVTNTTGVTQTGISKQQIDVRCIWCCKYFRSSSDRYFARSRKL